MSPKIIDNYQEKRADRRDKRGVKKGEGTLDASGNYVPTDANSKFNKKTQFIRNKSDKYQNQSKCTPGSVTVNVPPFVFTKYPSPATAVNVVVLTACQSVT